MSSPQFISTLSCLAEREENIKRLIENQKVNDNGCYFVRINVNGVWRYVPVDDSLPEMDGVALGARSYNDSESDLWAALIEKAYAKVHNGYNVFKNSTIPREHYLRDLTGVPIKKLDTYLLFNSEMIKILVTTLMMPLIEDAQLLLSPNQTSWTSDSTPTTLSVSSEATAKELLNLEAVSEPFTKDLKLV